MSKVLPRQVRSSCAIQFLSLTGIGSLGLFVQILVCKWGLIRWMPQLWVYKNSSPASPLSDIFPSPPLFHPLEGIPVIHEFLLFSFGCFAHIRKCGEHFVNRHVLCTASDLTLSGATFTPMVSMTGGATKNWTTSLKAKLRTTDVKHKHEDCNAGGMQQWSQSHSKPYIPQNARNEVLEEVKGTDKIQCGYWCQQNNKKININCIQAFCINSYASSWTVYMFMKSAILGAFNQSGIYIYIVFCLGTF